MSQIIGRFEPFMSCHKAFDVASMEPSDSMGDPGYIGKKVDGSSFHVFNKHWKWIPLWTGEGLPPAGIDVEIHNKSGRGVVDGAESFIGTTCKVLATFVNMNGYEMVSVEDSVGSCMCFRADMCGPVRTPEQIAAQARSKACDEMFGIMSSPPVREGNRSDMAEALYDAGYRKLATKEN